MVASNHPHLHRPLSVYLAAVLSLCATLCQGLDISYCSPYNNAGNYPSYYNQFQSNGACQDHCQGSYAFAVLQGYYCWCSNYIPTPQESTLNCNEQCPGFPSEWCGSTDDGLYGYYLLSPGVPAGTSGSGSSTPSSISSTSSPSSSNNTPPPSSSPTPTPTPTEVYTSITTVTGEVRTVVVTPTPATSADATLGQGATGGGGVSTGKVVGIVLGVALGLGALIGAGVFFWFRRRQRRLHFNRGPEAAFISRTGDTSPSNNVPSRQVSQLSSSGLLGTKLPQINTSGLALGNGILDTAPSNIDRRSLGTDQRLNPYALYIHDESRLSNVSLQDNQDYSRQLRVANPDL